MSDYVSMKTMKLKNEIMRPQVLDKIRQGNLTLKDVQSEQSPLKVIYLNTYNYLYSDDPLVSFSNEKPIVIPNPDQSNSPNFYMPRNIII
jgi:hypothetical protein